MALSDVQKHALYVQVLRRWYPDRYSQQSVTTAPTANLRACCAHHGMDVQAMDAGTPTMWTMSPARLTEALTWYAGQSQRAPAVEAYMPPPVVLRSPQPQGDGWTPPAVCLRRR